MKPTFLARYGLLSVVILAGGMALWFQYTQLINPYAVEEDFRRHHWFDGFVSDDLFEQDPAVGSFVVQLETPLGSLTLDRRSPLYGLIFQLGGRLLPIVLLSKLLIFPLLMSATYYVYRIGELAEGPTVAFILAVTFILINLASNTMSSTTGGLQRSFTAPLCLALIYYVMTKRDGRAAAVITMSGLLYAPIFVIGVILYGMEIVSVANRTVKIQWRRLWPLLVAIGIVSAMLLPLLLQQSGGAEVGGDTGRFAFLNDPLFQKNGRHALFSLFPLIGHGGLTLKGVDILHTLFFFSALLIFWQIDKNSITTLPQTLKHFLLASILSFIAAWSVALLTSSFALYFPSRYTQATLLLFGLIAFMLRVGPMTQRAAAMLQEKRGWLRKIILPVTIFALGLVFLLPHSGGLPTVGRGNSRWLLLGLIFLLLFLSFIVWRKPVQPRAKNAASTRPMSPWLAVPFFVAALFYVQFIRWPFYVAPSAEIALFEQLETMPTDIMIGGAPCILDSVPMFANRQVLFSCEQIHPDFAVMEQSLEAYYSDDPSEIARFCEQHGVTHLLVDQRDFTARAIAAGDFLFEPFNRELAPRIQSQTNFVLRDLPPEHVLFTTSSLSLVACDHFS